MKKAIALGVLLGASFVSFAFAQTLPVAKNYDLYSNLNTRATVELSGTSVGSVAFGSWRDYSIDPTIANPTVRDQGILSVSAAPGYYSATRVEVNISPTSGSFTRISPECGGESRTNIISLKWFSDPKKLPTTGGFCLLESNKKYYFNIRYIKEDGTPACSQSTCGMYVDISYGGFVDSTKSISVPFTPAPIVLNSAGTPIVTSTYDLNAHPATRLIPATGGTRSVAIAFPTTKGGTFMMSPGVNEYIRPDRTEVNISTKPNDFTPIQPACNQVNEISSEINLQWVIKASDQPSWGACILEPNKIYYFNIRYVKADGTTACTQATCGAYVDLPPLGTISVASSANTQPSNLPKDCTTLSNNLALGSKDSNTNNEVTALQSFLSPMYLKVSPTGYYGNMTVAAVKAFQKEYGIDQVGRIGPTTRAKVQQLSCGENTTSASYTSPVAKSVVTQSQPTQNGTMQISSPWGGQNLRNTGVCTGEGCSFIPPITIIRWSGGTGDIATIDLYDTRNVKVKTIAQTSNSGSYIWNYDPSLYDGPYKIAIRAGNGYAETGYFMIGEGTNQITPNPIVVTCPTGQTLVNGVCQTTQPTVANTTPCPAVPSKSRTYSREQRSSWWDAQISGTTGVNTVTLGHYKYPETTEVGTFTYYGERCALSATPGTRTCPYTDSIYGSGADRNAYSILLHAPDPTNDPNEVGDRVYTAYKKPIRSEGVV